ncbi:hypothetical protein KC723_02300 [Candidatus Kaiserbacteria bacterium]|nr:hypothetical protein [Candidatus Kaiserbacteria bacterium]
MLFTIGRRFFLITMIIVYETLFIMGSNIGKAQDSVISISNRDTYNCPPVKVNLSMSAETGKVPTVSGLMDQAMLDAVKGRERIRLSSPGGLVSSIEALAKIVNQIEITKFCRSGCAWLVANVDIDNVCIDESIKVLTFHTAVRQVCKYSGERVVSEKTTEKLLDSVHPELRKSLEGLLPDERLINITREEFLSIYPDREC